MYTACLTSASLVGGILSTNRFFLQINSSLASLTELNGLAGSVIENNNESFYCFEVFGISSQFFNGILGKVNKCACHCL